MGTHAGNILTESFVTHPLGMKDPLSQLIIFCCDQTLATLGQKVHFSSQLLALPEGKSRQEHRRKAEAGTEAGIREKTSY